MLETGKEYNTKYGILKVIAPPQPEHEYEFYTAVGPPAVGCFVGIGLYHIKSEDIISLDN